MKRRTVNFLHRYRASRCLASNIVRVAQTALACCVILFAVAPIPSLAQSDKDDSTDNTNYAGDVLAAPTNGLHQWGAVTLFHGLPSDQVRAIAQDSDGTMWFGTDGGLAKYDGRRTQTVAADGLPAGRVLALAIDAEGALWIGTETGAARFVGKRFYTLVETTGKSITAIITTQHGRALLGSAQGIIFDCQTQADGSISVRSMPDQPLLSADADHAGALPITSLALAGNTLYAGTMSRGLLAVELNAGVAKEILSRPRPYFIEALEADASGHLWLGAKTSGEGSGLYDASAPQHPLQTMAEKTGTVTALRAGTERADLWVGTNGRGAFHYSASKLLDRFTFAGTAGGLRSNHINTIFVDREGVVWFGTDKGVCRYDPRALRSENISSDPESNFARALFQTASGQLLCGTNRGLFVYDKNSSAWQFVRALGRSAVYAIDEDSSSGRILVGSASGLYSGAAASRQLNADSSFTLIKADAIEKGDSVRALAQFAGATYIASFGRGVERLDGERRTPICPAHADDSPCREVLSLRAGKNGKLWIGTANSGVLCFDGAKITTDAPLEKLRGSAVWSIDDDADGRLWLATARGLYSYLPGHDLTLAVEGIDARNVVAAATSHEASGATPSRSPHSRGERVWCATAGGGLLKIFTDERFGNIVSVLDAEQGLPSQNVFAVLPVRSDESASEETVLIGTSRGVARYRPGTLAPTLAPTRIISNRLHETAELQRGLNLEYPQNNLVLEVAATSTRTYPEQFQYALLLFDGAGHVLKQKLSHDGQFAMENLRPGKYRVEARAYTKDLAVSAPLVFAFEVGGAPFPRATAALSILLALTLIALCWGYWQNRKIMRASEELAAANHELADARLRLTNEAEAERRRIARDLHDQTLPDLRRLLLLADRLPARAEEAGEYLAPPVFRQEIEAISQEIRRICEDLSPSVLENVGLTAALEWALANAVAYSPAGCKFEYEFACDEMIEERLQFAQGVRMQIYRIVQETINNVCRHAGATWIKVTATLSPEGEFAVRVEDNGDDFNPKNIKRKSGRGLANILARANLIEAEAAWHKRAEGGTVFTLRKASG